MCNCSSVVRIRGVSDKVTKQTGIITSIFTITWVLTFVGGIMFTIKELQDRVPDLIGKVYTEGAVTVIEINHGRIKIMPKHRKPK